MVHGRDVNLALRAQHFFIETEVTRLADVVEFFAQPRRELFEHARRVDGLVVTAVQPEGPGQLAQVRFDRAGHVRVLELAGDLGAVVEYGAVHLPQRRGGGGIAFELGETALPV